MAGQVWRVSPPAPSTLLRDALRLGIHPLVAQILCNRGQADAAAMVSFLDPSHRVDHDSYQLVGMGRAVSRLARALRDEEIIVVHGDYDADGLTATALLVQTLHSLGGRVRPYLPHRGEHGYGVHAEALAKLREEGAGLVLTADCGISSRAEVALGRELGVDFVVTDHHEVRPPLPDAVAVLNPKRGDCPYPFRDLSGVGVAFKLAQALLSAVRPRPGAPGEAIPQGEGDLLDLVAIGTVADVVPLVGENRSLVRLGLQALNAARRPGLRELVAAAGLRPGELDEGSIGYALAPRLNAAGRIGYSSSALRLLLTDSPEEARACARTLDQQNALRQRLTEAGHKQARELVDTDAPIIVVAHETFVPGVVGLIASRLCEEYGRPAVVMARANGLLRGSARSTAQFDIAEAFAACEGLLLKHGGHPLAAGLTLAAENFDALRAQLYALADAAMGGVDWQPALAIDDDLPLGQADEALCRALAGLAPFGCANSEPVFRARRLRVRGGRAVGRAGTHLKLTLEEGDLRREAIGFGLASLLPQLAREVDIAYSVALGEWRGEARVEVHLRDVRPA